MFFFLYCRPMSPKTGIGQYLKTIKMQAKYNPDLKTIQVKEIEEKDTKQGPDEYFKGLPDTEAAPQADASQADAP